MLQLLIAITVLLPAVVLAVTPVAPIFINGPAEVNTNTDNEFICPHSLLPIYIWQQVPAGSSGFGDKVREACMRVWIMHGFHCFTGSPVPCKAQYR